MGLFTSKAQIKASEETHAPPGTRLWEILEVNEDLIPFDCRRGAYRMCLWWSEAGRPTGGTALSCFLHSAINRCKAERVRYPKISLLRLKQLQRGEWSPPQRFQAASRQEGLEKKEDGWAFLHDMVSSPEQIHEMAKRQERRNREEMAQAYRNAGVEVPKRYVEDTNGKPRAGERKEPEAEHYKWDDIMR